MTAPRSVTITMPFPPKELHAHNTGHWRGKAKHVKAMRSLAMAETMATGARPMKLATVSYAIYYPANRNYDLMNTAHSMKPAVDGVVDAGLIPDDNWKILAVGSIVGELDRDNPRIELTFTERTTDE